MNSKIFTSVNSIESFVEVSTKMTDKLFILCQIGRGKNLGPTYFPDFAALPFAELVVFLITRVWKAYLFQFLALLDPVKNILRGLTRRFIKK